MPKRRQWDSKTKAKIVLEVISGVLSPAESCRKYELAESVLARWRREFVEKADLVFGSDGSIGDGNDGQIEELQQMVGKQAIELEALKKGLGILQQKKGKRW
jgi:transposase-like protein